MLWIGSIGPLGHSPASGTVAVAVAGIPLFLLMHRLSIGWYVGLTVVLTLVSVYVHQVGDRLLGEKDSRKLVLDELVGYLIAMTCAAATWQLIVLGFFLERAIDIAKVPPANVVERRLPGGWGVVGDDVIAGLYTLGLLHLVSRLAPGLVGLG
ncbi:MAG: phosphatidylglycerophosphatase A [bacterium]|nr:phosphatidylglycerophosphatase A [bacterium]